jgi:hypothetical protein
MKGCLSKVDNASCRRERVNLERTDPGVMPILMRGSRCSHSPSLRAIIRKCLVPGLYEDTFRSNVHI